MPYQSLLAGACSCSGSAASSQDAALPLRRDSSRAGMICHTHGTKEMDPARTGFTIHGGIIIHMALLCI